MSAYDRSLIRDESKPLRLVTGEFSPLVGQNLSHGGRTARLLNDMKSMDLDLGQSSVMPKPNSLPHMSRAPVPNLWYVHSVWNFLEWFGGD